jgi:hypothetical protein
MMAMFLSGMLIGVLATWLIVKRAINDWHKDLEKLKDFDFWKEWKNK